MTAEVFFIPLVAFGASLLTFFSGFGLGTLLTPAFAVFFFIDIAVALTAVVHFLNNLFKLTLVGRSADRNTIFRFGLPAIVASFVGARVLVLLSGASPLFSYVAFGREFQVLPVKLVVAVVMIAFTLFEILPRYKNMALDRKYVPMGGLLSGFFGGISGHQGALRSVFLVKLGLSKDSFIGTGVVIACMIDIARISVYSTHFSREGFSDHVGLLVIATLAAFAGAYLGNRVLKKLTMRLIQNIVSVMVLLIAIGLGSGLI